MKRVSVESQARTVRKESEAHRDYRDPRDQQDPADLAERMDCGENKAYKDHQDQQDRPDPEEIMVSDVSPSDTNSLIPLRLQWQ